MQPHNSQIFYCEQVCLGPVLDVNFPKMYPPRLQTIFCKQMLLTPGLDVTYLCISRNSTYLCMGKQGLEFTKFFKNQ